jgi:hypothetical protein
MKLDNSTYDLLKWLAINFVPSLSAFVGVVGCSIGWEGTAVATTIISAFGVFLAGCIRMSIAEYEKAKKEQYEGQTDAE